MKILFIAPHPPFISPSQRFRFEQYFQDLIDQGYVFDYFCFISMNTWPILFENGHRLRKLCAVICGFVRVTLLFWKIFKYDFIFVHRGATPFGPPYFEWVTCKVFRKKLIYDFDDAIWLYPEKASWFERAKWRIKVGWICQWAYKVSCGNQYLAAFARQFNSQVIVNPTTIDLENLHNCKRDQKVSQVVVGWTGSHTTLKYLDLVLPVLKDLQATHDFEFLVIANRDPKLKLKNFRFISWNKESEIEDLLKINIGIMPLTDDPWSQGKCGFKALQYSGLGMPSIASPVGVNADVVLDQITGFLCSTAQEWKTALRRLIEDEGLRSAMGSAGRAHIQNKFSRTANRANFLKLFS